MEERIVELEIKLAYQDKMLRDLDEIVTAYAAKLDTLVREVAELRLRFDQAQPDEITDEPPPHY